MGAIMNASGNLVCRLIARSLLDQLVPRIAPLRQYRDVGIEALATYYRQLDVALATRDLEAVRTVYAEFSKLTQHSIKQLFAAYKQAHNGAAQEGPAS